ncbi:S-layer homology domain-containing protein [Salibacterium qingdaonense]|uniref:S-layer homology domain-containing protein n=1 Tax=Salibacterium qingdaonense TaxID=266892 RepID=A0A1I4LNK9_9BACI|nr:S-layer homology domain-containing protein [Salibacterium qingdaonense]SFL92602.1 S-layer homology domain-containing protein [Salibacterium qingdaonense]
MRKIIGWMLFLTVPALVWGAVSGEAKASFGDVGADFWASEEIEYLQEEGVVSGYPGGTFAPNREVTRHQAAGMLAEVLDLNTENNAAGRFSDVKEDTPHAGAIAAVAEDGIFQGSDGMFRPGEKVTRAQMAAVLKRAFDVESAEQAYFVDVAPNHWAFADISAVTGNGIAGGKEDRKSFHPNEATTRAQFSVFLTRAVMPEERLEEPGSVENQLRDMPAPESLEIGEASEKETVSFVKETQTWMMDVWSLPVSGQIWTISEEEKQAMFSHLGSRFSDNVIQPYFDQFYEREGAVYVFQEGSVPMIPEKADEKSVQVNPAGSRKTTVTISAVINDPGITYTHESLWNQETSVFEQFSTVRN